ncbi:ABC transporter permease [Paraclostridium bifermentans]|uniref:ABC transporter permease n=1 Tax=Paraclostridium bifermentans TaxID=1490 RepID=UPI00359C5104
MVIIKNAIENIKTNKIRVIAAMVWIVLGITSVIVVSSIGNGIEKKSLETKKNPEFRKLVVNFYANPDSPIGDSAFYEPFTQEDITRLSNMKEIELVTPKYGDSQESIYSGELRVGENIKYAKLTQYKNNTKLDIAYGRKFSIEDLERKTIIIDHELAYNLFYNDPKSAVGESINLNGEIFEVIGVLKEIKVDPQDTENSYRELESYLPKKSLEELGNKGFSSSTITGLDILTSAEYDTYEALDKINKMFEETKNPEDGSYGINGNSDAEMDIQNLSFMINTFTKTLSKISLFIGGIGIMNIMYMAVSERKREIGIRRAIGAQPKDILIQFLIETVVITVLGGIIGMVVGTFAANYASLYVGVDAIPNVQSYMRAFFVSIATGAIFGVIPAIKAAKLDPIKAIQG